MFRVDKNYTQYRDETDQDYPGGKAIDAPSGDNVEGTQYDERFFNQVFGFFQAVILDAYGEMRMSGVPDNANESEVLDALKTINAKVTDKIQSLVNANINSLTVNFREHDEIRNMINQNEVRITVLENAVYMDVVSNPFMVEFLNLDGIELLSGVWVKSNQSLECSRYGGDISVSFNNLHKVKLLGGIWNAPYNQLEC
jgi:hypothetical protein